MGPAVRASLLRHAPALAGPLVLWRLHLLRRRRRRERGRGVPLCLSIDGLQDRLGRRVEQALDVRQQVHVSSHQLLFAHARALGDLLRARRRLGRVPLKREERQRGRERERRLVAAVAVTHDMLSCVDSGLGPKCVPPAAGLARSRRRPTYTVEAALARLGRPQKILGQRACKVRGRSERVHERLSLELAGDDLGGALELPQVDLAAGGLAQRLPRVAVLELVAEQRVLEGREQEAELGAACVQGSSRREEHRIGAREAQVRSRGQQSERSRSGARKREREMPWSHGARPGPRLWPTPLVPWDDDGLWDGVRTLPSRVLERLAEN